MQAIAIGCTAARPAAAQCPSRLALLTTRFRTRRLPAVHCRVAPAVRGSLATSGHIARTALGLMLFAANCGTADAEAVKWLPWTAPTPDFVLAALDGGSHEFTGSDGRIVVVHFFATWCAPCRAELPALQRFAARADPARLIVLTVSVAEPDSRVRRLRDELALALPILLDRDRAVTRAWQIALLPTSVVLGPGGASRLGIAADIAWDQVDADALIQAAAAPPETSGPAPEQ